jgi:hypothetical protein
MLAAKAAGFDTSDPLNDESKTCLVVYAIGETRRRIFDPLKNSSDAFGLMVALKLDIDMNERSVSVWVNQKTSPVTEEFGDNEAAAVRRAIVRAAALIGEAL